MRLSFPAIKIKSYIGMCQKAKFYDFFIETKTRNRFPTNNISNNLYRKIHIKFIIYIL